MRRRRWTYALAAAALLGVEIYIAAAVHDSFVRPFGGDALAVVLVYLALRAATPLRVLPAAAAALAFAFLIEVGQGIGILRLLGLAGNRYARIVLGTGFDPKDFVAYTAGGAAILAVERLLAAGRDRRA